jgi:hypothetical protein
MDRVTAAALRFRYLPPAALSAKAVVGLQSA